jgi:hypothetical protein
LVPVGVLARWNSTLRSSSGPSRRTACDRATILSWGLALLQGVTHTSRRIASRHRPLPWSFYPFSAWSTGSPYDLGHAFPSTFRLQGFAPSCRITPPCASRVYFTPVALMGFHPSGICPPKELCHLLRCAPCPLDVCSQSATDVHGNVSRGRSQPAHLGFAVEPLPPSGPYSPRESVRIGDRFYAHQTPIPSWASASLRCSPPQGMERISPLLLSRALPSQTQKSCPF